MGISTYLYWWVLKQLIYCIYSNDRIVWSLLIVRAFYHFFPLLLPHYPACFPQLSLQKIYSFSPCKELCIDTISFLIIPKGVIMMMEKALFRNSGISSVISETLIPYIFCSEYKDAEGQYSISEICLTVKRVKWRFSVKYLKICALES